MRITRIFFGTFVAFFTFPTFAQTISARPDVRIQVKEEETSGELVEVTMLSPTFPEKEMLGAMKRLGEELRMTPRGFPYYTQAFGSGPRDKFVKARVGVAGLIDRTTGDLNIQAIARAFAGIPKPNDVDVLTIVFESEQANERTLKSYASDFVAVDGQVLPGRAGIEYLVYLRTQDREKIVVPSRHTPETAKPKESEEQPRSGMALPLIGLLALASVAAGCLVYFLALSRNRTPR